MSPRIIGPRIIGSCLTLDITFGPRSGPSETTTFRDTRTPPRRPRAGTRCLAHGDTRLPHGLPDRSMTGLGQPRQGQSDPASDEPHLVERPFHRDGVGLGEQITVQAAEPRIDGRRPCSIPHQGGGTHLVHGLRGYIGGHGDHPLPAPQDELHAGGIVPAQEHEIGPAALPQGLDAIQVPARLLDTDDVLDPRQAPHRLGQHVAGRAARDVIQDLGNGHRLGHGPMVQIEPLLRGLVVVRCDEQAGIGTGSARAGGQADGLGGRVGAGAGDHRHPLADLPDDLADHLAVLLLVQGRRLTRGPDGHDAVAAVLDMELAKPPEPIPIDGDLRALPGLHRRGQGHDTASKHRSRLSTPVMDRG